MHKASLKLTALFDYASGRDIRLFVLVDEYGSIRQCHVGSSRAHEHQQLATGNGFYHSFFAALRDGAG